MRCTTCGDDGVCKPNSEVKVQECKPGTKNCFISLGSDGNGSFVDVKGCADNTGNEFGLRGCLHISGNVKHEINDEYCFCDTDECNSHRCEMEFCSCAFSDPEICRNITERNKSSKISFPWNWWFLSLQKVTSNVEVVLVKDVKMVPMLH